MTFIFLSYSHHDSQFVARLRTDLVAAQQQVWRDREDIRRGLNWDDSIETVLRSGQITHVLFVQSENSIVSEIVLNELQEARENRIKFIIPLIIDDSRTPLIVKRRNYIDFRLDYNSAFAELLAELAAHIEAPFIGEAEKQTQVIVSRTPTTDQKRAACDPQTQVRLLAGPGTGKSFVIEERVRWLLENGVAPKSIFVVSFTRASSADLRRRIVEYCVAHDQRGVHSVSVSTLHSLALKVLRRCGALDRYPTTPLILDEWEVEYIFDEEFKEEHGTVFARKNNKTIPERAEQVRRFYEAFWSTGEENPRDYMMPEIPITAEEKKCFERFLHSFDITYSCMLPGEIVAKCVEMIRANLLDPARVMGITHLIVDEYQDLNSSDIQFIDAAAKSNPPANVYVLGDDDQSIYSFRFAYPLGIQTFSGRFPQTSTHTLIECFRCTPRILRAATSLIQGYAMRQRLPKNIVPIHESIEGIVHGFSFTSEQREASFIAQSCKKLIEAGIDPDNILVLISSRDTQLKPLEKAFQNAGVDIEIPTGEQYIDTEPGRYIYAILRVACDLALQDYVAHRLIFGLPKGVGTKTCVNVRNKVVEHNLRFLEIFYYKPPQGVFSTRELSAIRRARKVFGDIQNWNEDDTIADRCTMLAEMVGAAFDGEETTHRDQWMQLVAFLPAQMNLRELREYLGAQSQKQRAQILENVYKRLNLEIPAAGFSQPRVQIMTMHGAKGLNAQVVFVPGLEDKILPGTKRRAYPGLVLEAARLLYVSITRSSAACILSFSKSRQMGNGRDFGRIGSEFLTSLGENFLPEKEALSDLEVENIVNTVHALEATG